MQCATNNCTQPLIQLSATKAPGLFNAVNASALCRNASLRGAVFAFALASVFAVASPLSELSRQIEA
jgi:hypothetical protein